MKTERIHTDNIGIHILLPGGSLYSVDWAKIERDGVDAWLNHLGEKNWFDNKARNVFAGFCNRHFLISNNNTHDR